MLLISTFSLHWYWLHKIFKLVKESGLDWINLDVVSWDYDTEDAEYIKELSKSFWIPVISITAYERKMDAETVDNLIDMAHIIWAKVINFYPPHRADKDSTWFSTYLTKVKTLKKDIELSVINVEPKTFLFFIPEYKDATLMTIKKITWKTTLAITNVDPSTWVDLLKTYSMLGKTVKNVYLWDKSWSKQDLMLGKWDMPLRDLFWKLKEANYTWLFTIKISPKELWVWNDKLVLEKIDETKKYFKKHYTDYEI